MVLWELLTGEIPYAGVDQAAVIYGTMTVTFLPARFRYRRGHSAAACALHCSMVLC